MVFSILLLFFFQVLSSENGNSDIEFNVAKSIELTEGIFFITLIALVSCEV